MTVYFRTNVQNINKIISEDGCSGNQADPTSLVIITATIDKSLPYNSSSLNAAYSLGYYTGISTHPEISANNDFDLQINNSESSIIIATIASYTGYCMGSSATGSYRKLLRQVLFRLVYDRTTGTASSYG